jgi:hypothetical protein
LKNKKHLQISQIFSVSHINRQRVLLFEDSKRGRLPQPALLSTSPKFSRTLWLVKFSG